MAWISLQKHGSTELWLYILTSQRVRKSEGNFRGQSVLLLPATDRSGFALASQGSCSTYYCEDRQILAQRKRYILQVCI